MDFAGRSTVRRDSGLRRVADYRGTYETVVRIEKPGPLDPGIVDTLSMYRAAPTPLTCRGVNRRRNGGYGGNIFYGAPSGRRRYVSGVGWSIMRATGGRERQ